VPAGSWTITFLYRAKGTSSGLALSGIGALGLVAVAAGALVRRRRKGGPLGARDEQ
jgi:MYXO-CTERM domain-containing protein